MRGLKSRSGKKRKEHHNERFKKYSENYASNGNKTKRRGMKSIAGNTLMLSPEDEDTVVRAIASDAERKRTCSCTAF